MDRERFFALGRELRLEKDALREWVDKECALARDERAREREEAKESAERQRLRQEQELKILELKFKLQESAGRQSAEANEPVGATSSVTPSTTRLRDPIIAEQFMESCLPALKVFLKERNCRTLQEIAQTSDNFMDAQSLVNLGKERACGETGPPTSLRMELARKKLRADNRCFLCDKKGHRAAECWSRTKACSPVHGHNSDKYSAGRGDRCEASCMVSGERNEEKAAGNAEYVILKDGEKVPVVNTAVSRSVALENTENVPTVKGFMDQRPVTVLRDTGCDTVIVRQALVPKERLTSAYRPVLFLDRTVRNLPEAVVFLDTPIFKGEVRAQCLRDSLYDVVLGNIKGALPLDTTRVMATRTPNRSSSADIEEKTPKTPTNRRSRRQDQVTGVVNRLRAPRPEPSDSSLSAANSDNHAACAKRWQATAPPSGSSQLSTSPVPQRRRPRQHSYFEERNTGRLNQSRPGFLTLRSDGTDSLSAQMDQSPSSPQPPLQPPQDQVKTARQLDFHGVNRALCVLCVGTCLFTRAGSVRAPRCDVYASAPGK
ncbi:hypothetical protein HPB52_018373 [Rhipicephalus sanguineus]|uniref:CCHC-type domain-containing protein n=1 Tax=Rhipicephalus sanguineus TaxID=34632 RepID=A0A9D4PS72_RHISA|nr:hypothetical protein HPB52_018373 [Rhipicephalus sanguineus]